jgi:hypothetical protein
MSRLIKGSRFKLSPLGAARCPRFFAREGVIVGSSRLNSSVRVLFDGYKSPISLHRDYIDQILFEAERDILAVGHELDQTCRALPDPD